ncbi:MAG TPA: hypothetical protein DHW82_00375 [Spirochaetia bacterium]|nr:MAG: hypothetical protein A2Y41_07260 [Spirochaetes bacterium GWB1_36_13]HCL55454.1 hypothetical protein [Spirochaetia bacterium]
MRDIRVGENDLVFNYSDFASVEGKDLLVQSLVRRLMTVKGSLFYAPEFGSRLYQFIQAGIDSLVLDSVKAEIIETVESFNSVVPETVKCSVSYQVPDIITAEVSFYFYGLDDLVRLGIVIGREVSAEVL